MEVNERDETKRGYLSRAVASYGELPSAIRSESKYFVLFLAADARDISDLELRRVSKALLEQGCCYLCVWGPDCKRVHDQFDKQRAIPELNCVMTTWHAKESLREALDFFVYCAWPTDGFAKSPVDWIAVCVGNADWSDAISADLSEVVSGA